MDYPYGVNQYLELKALSAANLAKLLEDNGITGFQQDFFHKPHLHMYPNLTKEERVEDGHGATVPAYFTPASERGYLSSEERPIFDDALRIQKMVSQDSSTKSVHYSNIILRKMATGVAMLKELKNFFPFQGSRLNFNETKYLIEDLLEDGQQKLEHIRIVWNWHEKHDGGYFGEVALFNLKGGKELFEQALAEAYDPNIFDRIQACVDKSDPEYVAFEEEHNRQALAYSEARDKERRAGKNSEPKPAHRPEPEQQRESVRGQIRPSQGGNSGNPNRQVNNARPVKGFEPLPPAKVISHNEAPTPFQEVTYKTEAALIAQKSIRTPEELIILSESIRKLPALSKQAAKLGTTLNQWMFLEDGTMNLPYILEYKLAVTDAQRKQLKTMVSGPKVVPQGR